MPKELKHPLEHNEGPRRKESSVYLLFSRASHRLVDLFNSQNIPSDRPHPKQLTQDHTDEIAMELGKRPEEQRDVKK